MNRCYEKESVMPIYECPINQVCTKVYHHEVPHIVPINVETVNHHIYHHTYTPCYKYSECDTDEHVMDSCCKL